MQKEINGTLKNLTDEEYKEIIDYSESNDIGFDEIITSCVKRCIKLHYI